MLLLRDDARLGAGGLIRRYQRNPVHIAIEPENATVATVEQRYYEMAERDKLDAFMSLEDEFGRDARLLIFRRDCRSGWTGWRSN